ncbi:hypothetical protein LCGC14_2599750 [marine sediment metagenome]|uniref:Uncharacterized protein n=1 Tax=marine sediment metagenome TaxID=412755 RepID=A0A0F9CK23_9ZZZZ
MAEPEANPEEAPTAVKTKRKRKKKRLQDKYRCRANNKNCRACDHVYVKGSKLDSCPECGEERRCENPKIKKRPTCRMHGSKGGRPPSSRKYRVAKSIEDAYNRILGDKDIFTLSQEIAIIGSRVQQLNDQMDTYADAANYEAIRLAYTDIQDGVLGQKFSMINGGLQKLDKALVPIEAQAKLWQQLNTQIEMYRRIAATQHRWMKDSDQMVTMNEVVEIIADFTTMVFKYIKTPQDRQAFTKECTDKGYTPSDNGSAP